MMRQTEIPMNVTCAIICKDDLILVTQRSELMKMPLKWEFPGGKVEAGETDEQCLIRELKEELNIDVVITEKLPSQRYSYPDFEITLLPFIARYVSGDIRLYEHKAFQWVRPLDLPALDWAEADIPVVNHFLNVHRPGSQ